MIDYNKWQATGRSNEITSLEPLEDKWQAFGWDVQTIDGHDFDQIKNALKKRKPNNQKPKLIVANTIKGKGISFMEDDNNWHYKTPNQKELIEAIKEIKAEK